MSTLVWQKLGSPILQPSTTTLWAYDNHPTVLIDIEVVNNQLDYNLLLGRSYMYTMRAVASTIFHLMMFPHEGNIMTVDQLTYHDPRGLTTLSNVIHMINTIDLQGLTATTNVIPMVNTMVDKKLASPLLNVGPRLFANTTMETSFPFV